MPRTYVHQDPAGCQRLITKLARVCGTVSASDQVTKEQLRDLARNPAKDPTRFVTKNNQSYSQTCSANSGEYCLSVWTWQHTGLIHDYSRLWLYLQGKLKWDTRTGRFADNGCSIPSIAETLYEKGVPFETFWSFDPDSSHWPTAEQFRRAQTTQLTAAANANRCKSMTPISEDFDVTIARVALGDPFFWGHGWPFPNGGSGHATCGAWIIWDESLRDFVLKMGNSHKDREIFTCTRRQYASALRSGNYGGYHLEGNLDVRFRLNQLVM